MPNVCKWPISLASPPNTNTSVLARRLRGRIVFTCAQIIRARVPRQHEHNSLRFRPVFFRSKKVVTIERQVSVRPAHPRSRTALRFADALYAPATIFQPQLRRRVCVRDAFALASFAKFRRQLQFFFHRAPIAASCARRIRLSSNGQSTSLCQRPVAKNLRAPTV